MRRALAALLSAPLALPMAAPAEAAPQRTPAAKPAASVSTPAITPERAALLAEQPQDVTMAPNAVGWLKECADPKRPRDCTLGTGFALAPDTPENLLMTVSTSDRPGNHTMRLTLPINVSLRPGFTLVLDDGQAVLGDYTTCGAKGCWGEVTLPDTVYRRLFGSAVVRVVIGNASDRSLRLSLPLAGFTQAAAEPATPSEEVNRRREAAAVRIKAARSPN